MVKKMKDAVINTDWFSGIRQQFETFEEIPVNSNWYKVYRLPHDVLAIAEPFHFQEVISFLIFGKEKALLLDTGMGIEKMKPLVDSLCKLPYTVINSHTHFDHVGGNWEFDEVLVYKTLKNFDKLHAGIPFIDVEDQIFEGCNAVEFPEGFHPYEYHILPSEPSELKQKEFNLGERTLKVIHTPGHCDDAIMLVDSENKILFTGDTFYPATLYAHFFNEDGKTDFKLYADTMKKLADTYDDYTLYCSHNEPIVESGTLSKVSDAFQNVLNDEVEYEVDEKDLKKYTFDGFAIVKR